MSLKPIEPRHFAQDDVDPGTGAKINNKATSMNHYVSQQRRPSSFTMSPDVTGGMKAYTTHEQPKQDKRKTAILIAVIVAAVALALVGLFVGFSRLGSDPTVQQEQGEVRLSIPTGYGAGDIAQLLRDNGVVSSTKDFVQAVNAQDAEANLKPGTYIFERGASVESVVAALVAGPELGVSVTIPEGLTVSQTAQRVADAFEHITYEDFMAHAKASNYVGDYAFLNGAYNNSLEGFLFPKTYFFDKEVSVDTVIRTMLSQFQQETAGVDWSAATQGGVALTQYEVVIMASLVERETAVATERPIVASVMYNRLNLGMQLQVDAAIAYALNKSDLITYEDLAVESPYNLYTNYGLCPGPICSPSLEAIQAVVAADTTDYIYYIASSTLDGSHTFASTYEDFEIARNAYNEAMGIVG